MAQMTRDELCFMSIGEASGLLRERKLSPVELTQAYLDRIEALDGRVRSYVTLLPEAALQEARTAEDEIGKGEYKGPMHGVPIAYKDLYDTAGVRTTGQSKVLEHRVPEEDCTAIVRLREAGAVNLGKLAMHEFALGGPKTSLFDQACNPWNLDHVTGGSSSGSGAAMAAGLAMGTLGSDTGGSIRGPAALCGIVGLKPTYGRVSRYGVLPLSWSLDHCGPMTWTVEDAALMLQAIAGHDPKDPTSSTAPVPDYAAALGGDLRGLTVGVPRHYFFGEDVGLDPEVADAVNKGIETLGELGAEVRDIEIPVAGVREHRQQRHHDQRGARVPPEEPAVAAGELRRHRADAVHPRRGVHVGRLRAVTAGAEPHPAGVRAGAGERRHHRRDGDAEAGGGAEGLRPAGHDDDAEPDGAVQPDGAAVDVGAGGVLVRGAAHRHADRRSAVPGGDGAEGGARLPAARALARAPAGALGQPETSQR